MSARTFKAEDVAMKIVNISPPHENANRKKSGVFDPETAVSLLNPAKPAAAALRPTPTPIRGSTGRACPPVLLLRRGEYSTTSLMQC